MRLTLDLVAAFLAFLKFRWLQRLSTEEKGYLEDELTIDQRDQGETKKSSWNIMMDMPLPTKNK
jgi:hypothetical protein